MKETILEMKSISKSFPGVKALSNVDFRLNRGEVHVLVGENGAGKSTLLKILAGAYQADKGDIVIDGKPVRIQNPREALDMGITIIYQELTLLPHLSVGENMYLGRLPPRRRLGFMVDRKKLYKDSQDQMDRLGIPVDPKKDVRGLGIASQQMIEIAKALTQNARIIAMDEPTSSLSGREIEELFSIIRILRDRGVGIIYVSHRLHEVHSIGDRVTVLKDGANAGSAIMAETDVTSLIRMMVGRDLNNMFPKANIPVGNETLKVEGLSRKGAFSDISFSVRKGEIVSLAGLVGAGRTEVAHAVFGVDHIDGGRVLINGKQVIVKSPSEAIKHGIALMPEDRKGKGLILLMSVKDNITLANLKSFALLRLVIQKGKERASVQKLMRDLRIKTTNTSQKVLDLSGGNQQKVVVAKWLCSKASILFMDEPTRGIDVGAKIEVYELMNEMLKNGATIVMISSELPEVLAMSDRIYVMHEGKITGHLTKAEATEEKIMAMATGNGKANAHMTPVS